MIVGAPAHTDDPLVLDRDLDAAAIGAQHAGGRDPPVDVCLREVVDQVEVDARRPRGAFEGCAATPGMIDTVRHAASSRAEPAYPPRAGVCTNARRWIRRLSAPHTAQPFRSERVSGRGTARDSGCGCVAAPQRRLTGDQVVLRSASYRRNDTGRGRR